jgi:para-aminobenzoate synthetase component 1
MDAMVQRQRATFPITDLELFKRQMLSWANRFNICCFLDNHGYTHTYHRYECLLAAGAVRYYAPARYSTDELNAFVAQHNDWLFGHISYPFSHTPGDTFQPADAAGFRGMYFFQPAIVIAAEKGVVHIEVSAGNGNPQQVFTTILQQTPAQAAAPASAPVFTPAISRDTYLSVVQALQQHILRGDCYEINFCQEFHAQAVIDPLATYLRLVQLSPTPFAAFYRLHEAHLLCASPERFFYTKEGTIVSQPIKGTIRRDAGNPMHDEQLKHTLFHSSKDRSENVMVVDLVRNDLSKICREGSVAVEELFGLYSFPQVHQLISTVKGVLENGVSLGDIIQACFPMGSMTGAPKQKVMELIGHYETGNRGIYSGAVGYISPEKNMDFNVVIRSLLYNAGTHYLGYQVGGGITFYSDPEKEYEECLLKAAAIKKALQ